MGPRCQSITTLQITNKYCNTVTCPKNQITCPAVTSLKSYQLKRQNRESNFKSFDYWADMHDRRHGLAQYQSAQCKEKCFEGKLTYAFNIRELLSNAFSTLLSPQGWGCCFPDKTANLTNWPHIIWHMKLHPQLGNTDIQPRQMQPNTNKCRYSASLT
jgi:hypothetical protein